MKNCKQIATEWGLSERTVNDLCKKNKIDGAIKVGKMWKIPDDAKKPIDGRITSGKYVRHSAGVTRKPLPIGISDYVRAQADYYYVDKTMLIKEFLDQKPLVSLFTRPRRFGKTLNMDMLRVFFEISEENTSKYFEDKAIWQCGEEYRNQQGQYPVVFLTFKDVKFDSWKATLDKIRDLLQEEFGRHQELATSERIAEYEKTYFAKIINGDASEVDLTASLAKLSQMLTKHYGKAPIIIIDEYDTPIQEGYSKDFYDEIIGFMRNFFSGAFKDNKNLTYGFLTGILRIAQESIFSGLNNLTVNSVMDEEYDQFFGFTVSEVREMLKYYGVLDKEEELKDWYDGYLFGSTEIYNPWSVINYISRGCIPQAYWVNTGKNEILEDVLKVATEDITERLYSLLQGERVIARIDQNVVYRSLSEDPANIYSLLLVAGYLKTPKKELQADGSYLCEVSIPNREIAAVYKSEVLSHLLQIGAITRTTANKIAESLYANDYKNLQKAIAEYMDKSVSFYDAGAEGFYHGLVLGLIALMDNQYKIKSNRESGDGRYDIGLFPREDRYPGKNNNTLLDMWSYVRHYDENMFERLQANGYISTLDESIFEKTEDEIILCLGYDGLYGVNNINRYMQKVNPSNPVEWGNWVYKVGDKVLFNDNKRFGSVLYNNLKGTIVTIDRKDEEIVFQIQIDKKISDRDIFYTDLKLHDCACEGKSIVEFSVKKRIEKDSDTDYSEQVVPFQIAYAVSIHKAQGLEYKSVKVVITEDVDEQISHNIFYTAITRTTDKLKIYLSKETQKKLATKFVESNVGLKQAQIFAQHAGLKLKNKLSS